MKCTFAMGYTKALTELDGLALDARWAWLTSNSISLKFGNGFYSESTIRVRALKVGCMGTVKCSYKRKAGISAPWWHIKTFEITL